MPRSLVSTAVLAAVLAGCGGSGSSSTGTPSTSAPATPPATTPAPAGGASAPGATSLAIAADPSGQLAFDKKSLSAKAGQVTIAFTNSSPTAHNFTLESGGRQVSATPTFSGGSKTLSISLKPGTYTFLCTVPGHAQAGMMGSLTVR